MPFHVRTITNTNPPYADTALDLTEHQLQQRFLAPYREGRPIVIRGHTIQPGELQRILITWTEQTSDELRPILRAQRAASWTKPVEPDDWRIADAGKDVTDEHISAPPGDIRQSAATRVGTAAEVDPREVLVVHGRNLTVRTAMFEFLRSIDLHPIEWSEAVAATGSASPYVGQVLDAAFARARAVVVLMTPDDEGKLRGEFLDADDLPYERVFTGQARLNVVFEAGMAMGRDRTRPSW